MDNENLVETITKEVIKRVEEMALLEKKNKDRILILSPKDTIEFKSLNEKLKEVPYQIDSLDDKKSDLKEYSTIVVCGVDNRELANLALGVQCGIKEQIIINTLLNGRKIYLIRDGIEYRKYSNTANKFFYKLYQDYEKKISDYGVSVIDSESLFKELMSESKDAAISDNEEEEKTESSKEKKCIDNKEAVDMSNKKIISESELKMADVKGINKILLSKKSIITPLAKDFIRSNKIICEFED